MTGIVKSPARGPEPEPARLFGTGQRWGWEYRHVAACVPVFRQPPVLAVPEPSWAAKLGPAFERFQPNRRLLLVCAALCGVGAVVTARYGARWDARALQNTTSGQVQASYHLASWPPFLAAATVLFAAIAVLRHAILRGRLERSRGRWMREVAAANAAYRGQYAEWDRARQAYLAAEQARLTDSPQWYAIRPDPMRRLDVFGGSAAGWEMLLVSAGCPLMGAGGRVSVVDLSQEDVVQGLLRAATRDGRPCTQVTLPAQSAAADLFAGLSATAVADVLTETVHGGDNTLDQAARGIDARVLGAVTEVLGASVTVDRICAALRVLLRQEQPPDEGSPLSGSEHDMLSGMFGETFRRSTEMRIAALESLLHQLTAIGRDIGRAVPLYSPGAQLQVITIAEDSSSLASALTAQFVLHLLLARMRGTEDSPTADQTVVVAAADVLPHTSVEQLSQICHRRGIRLVLLFRHLRDHSEKLIGGADTVFVMRLGNAAEAARAAEFIGREHRFVVHQLTMTETSGTSDSVNLSQTAGFQRSSSHGFGGGSRSSSESTNVSRGTTQGGSSSVASAGGRQRVYEFVVEPTALQSLPETMFVFVDRSRRGGPRARVGDCDPRILSLPGVCDEPAVAWTHAR
jgi:hypothetical protein